MKVCENLLKTNLFKIYNSLKNIEYSLYGFSTTEIFYRNFELTNQRQGREIQNSKSSIFSADGAFSNQIKLGTFFTVLYYLDL